MRLAFTGIGGTVQVKAPDDLKAGDGFWLGPLFCVAMAPTKGGAPCAARIEGTFVVTGQELEPGMVVEVDGRPIGVALDERTVRLTPTSAGGKAAAVKSAVAPKPATKKRGRPRKTETDEG